MKKINKLVLVVAMIFGIVSLTGCNVNDKNNKLTIISTSFPGYDFARSIVKDMDNVEVKMLLKPGSETHDFEPTPKDIKDIKNSDIFIYVGGDSDEWIDDILDDIDLDKTITFKLMDSVNTYEEEIIGSMEEEEESEEEETEYDEHVWTSPINAIKIVKDLREKIVSIDQENESKYLENSNNYINKLTEIDHQIREVVANSKRKTIVFGDRFPLRYFVEEYGLKYDAAFPGCSDQTEASSKTIASLINKVKKENIPVIFKIELSSGKIANTISEETNAKVLEFNAAHNVSQSDFDAGITIADIMENNIKVLKEALN